MSTDKLNWDWESNLEVVKFISEYPTTMYAGQLIHAELDRAIESLCEMQTIMQVDDPPPVDEPRSYPKRNPTGDHISAMFEELELVYKALDKFHHVVAAHLRVRGILVVSEEDRYVTQRYEHTCETAEAFSHIMQEDDVSIKSKINSLYQLRVNIQGSKLWYVHADVLSDIQYAIYHLSLKVLEEEDDSEN